MPELYITADEIEARCNCISESCRALLHVDAQREQTMQNLRQSMRNLRLKLEASNPIGKNGRNMSGVMRLVRAAIRRVH